MPFLRTIKLSYAAPSEEAVFFLFFFAGFRRGIVFRGRDLVFGRTIWSFLRSGGLMNLILLGKMFPDGSGLFLGKSGQIGETGRQPSTCRSQHFNALFGEALILLVKALILCNRFFRGS